MKSWRLRGSPFSSRDADVAQILFSSAALVLWGTGSSEIAIHLNSEGAPFNSFRPQQALKMRSPVAQTVL